MEERKNEMSRWRKTLVVGHVNLKLLMPGFDKVVFVCLYYYWIPQNSVESILKQLEGLYSLISIDMENCSFLSTLKNMQLFAALELSENLEINIHCPIWHECDGGIFVLSKRLMQTIDSKGEASQQPSSHVTNTENDFCDLL